MMLSHVAKGWFASGWNLIGLGLFLLICKWLKWYPSPGYMAFWGFVSLLISLILMVIDDIELKRR